MPNVEDAVQYALAQRGKPYQWGKTGPDSFDCSGLMVAAFKAAGVKISRVTYTQVKDGRAVSRNELARGDLVFPDPGHVQMYLGSNTVIHSPRSGSFVQIASLDRVYAARRIIEGGQVSGDFTDVVLPGEKTGIRSYVDWITDTHNWFRLALIVAGGLLLLYVISVVSSGQIENMLTNVMGA